MNRKVNLPKIEISAAMASAGASVIAQTRSAAFTDAQVAVAVYLAMSQSPKIGTVRRPCAVCGASMLIGVGHGYANKQLCSHRCRMKSYRDNKTRTAEIGKLQSLTTNPYLTDAGREPIMQAIARLNDE